jgi:hypothetical protein
MSNIIYPDTIVSGIVCTRCNHKLPPMTAQEHLDGKFNKKCPHTKEIKFPVKVYTHNGDKKSTCAVLYMTEREMEDICCIFECCMYIRDSIPDDQMRFMDECYVDLYDIWNYECVPWWEWPEELKQVMYEKVPKSKPA